MACTESPAGIWNPTNWASVQTCHDDAGFDAGDTILLPSGTIAGDTAITFNKTLTLEGAGCPLDAKGRAIQPCSTKVTDSVGGSTLLEWNLPACSGCGLHNRIAGIEFEDNGRAGAGVAMVFSGAGDGNAIDDRRLRIDHVVFDSLNGNADSIRFGGGVYGVFDHNSVISTEIFMRFVNNLNYAYADKRWSEDLSFAGSPSVTGWGSDQFFFIENNNLQAGVITDGDSGNRFVARFNDVTHGYFESHGQDSQTGRAMRAVEVYKNSGDTDGAGVQINNMHGGTAYVWGNDLLGPNVAATWALQRSLQATNGVPVADGTVPMDVNAGGNPQASCTVASVGGSAPNQTVTCSGVSWTDDQWNGYYIHVQGCIPARSSQCGGFILDTVGATSTLNLLTLSAGWTVNVSASDTIDINDVTWTYDQVGRAGGNLGTRVAIGFGNIDHVGDVAVVHAASHGLDGTETIWVEQNSGGATNGADCYNGVWDIALGDDGGNDTTNYFHYTMGCTPDAGGVQVSAGHWTDLLWTSNNDQESDPAYQWLNTDGPGGSNLLMGSGARNIVLNRDMYDYEGTAQTAQGAPFTGDPTDGGGVGVGTIAQRPTTCTTGVAYWATDEGSWNTSGSGGQGRLYKCTATDTWTLWYTPYTYPHPLTSGSFPTTARKTKRGRIGRGRH